MLIDFGQVSHPATSSQLQSSSVNLINFLLLPDMITPAQSNFPSLKLCKSNGLIPFRKIKNCSKTKWLTACSYYNY